MFADCVEAVLTILLMQLHSGRILQTLMLLFCNGVLNMMHSTFAFTVLALVTPLSYAVANATKRIVIIGGSILILQNTVSPLNGLGMLIAVFGVLCYNKAKYDESQAARREKVLPLVHSDPKFYGHGVQHLAHSKSDANFLGSGLSNGTGASANGHILLQEWQQSDEGLVLLPVASRSFPERHLRLAALECSELLNMCLQTSIALVF
ncbi:hypothetical protein C0Q70_16799 [Pomacea canaliculata]|uniref:Sugar phosphate transporter domain-containing protein n=1 Tax=Pomacea canaliculata TaxID=400727 RepID=A0A2T7NQS4_POMCA|nr:hypothetical protein C0Q70_16799 [Pomacea canaliculata]